MKMSLSGNGFEPGARIALKRPSGGSKNRIFGPDRNKLARNECMHVCLLILGSPKPLKFINTFAKPAFANFRYQVSRESILIQPRSPSLLLIRV